MENERKRSINLMVMCSVVISLITLSVAFAVFSSTLKINGQAEVVTSKWDLHFSADSTVGPGAQVSINPIITALDASGNPVTPTATATAATGVDTDLSYSVTFRSPREQVQYEFYIVNNGDYNAKISTINKNNTLVCTSAIQSEANIVCNELTYTLTDSTGQIVTTGRTIGAKSSEKLILTLGYDMDGTMTPDILPTSPVTVSSDSLRVSIIYSQN